MMKYQTSKKWNIKRAWKKSFVCFPYQFTFVTYLETVYIIYVDILIQVAFMTIKYANSSKQFIPFFFIETIFNSFIHWYTEWCHKIADIILILDPKIHNGWISNSFLSNINTLNSWETKTGWKLAVMNLIANQWSLMTG